MTKPVATEAQRYVKCGHNEVVDGTCHHEVDMSSLTAMQMVELYQEIWDENILRCGCCCAWSKDATSEN